jgi:hypothetical protein
MYDLLSKAIEQTRANVTGLGVRLEWHGLPATVVFGLQVLPTMLSRVTQYSKILIRPGIPEALNNLFTGVRTRQELSICPDTIPTIPCRSPYRARSLRTRS